MTQSDLYIKANLVKFIKRFERENGSIVAFGSDITFEQKINIILNTFKNYANDENENTNEESQNDDRQSVEQQGNSESD
jgi:lipoate-protein ligase A